ncbi:MAG TPA: prolyl oligopeptidase family serine peptidase [Bacteriovoracaceae bacterium]|nr:prolyl oligopeptidase family serine peptidase [Bacteriovoracaceae bacterium]
MTKVLLAMCLTLQANVHATTPPVAKKIATPYNYHQDVRIDDYNWMHDEQDPEVRKHLELENSFAEAYNKRNEGLRTRLLVEYKKLRGSLSTTVVAATEKFLYFKTKDASDSYWKWYRREKKSGSRVLIFDENTFARDLPFYRTMDFKVSPAEDSVFLLADTKGRNLGTPHVIDLKTLSVTKLATTQLWQRKAEWIDDSRLLFLGAKQELDSYQLFEYRTSAQTEQLVQQFEDVEAMREVTRTADGEAILVVLSKSKSSFAYRYHPELQKLEELGPKNEKVKSVYNKNSSSWFKLTNEFSQSQELFQKINGEWLKIYSPKKGNIVSFHPSSNHIVIAQNFEGIGSLYLYDLKTRAAHSVMNTDQLLAYSEIVVDYHSEKTFFAVSGFTTPLATWSCLLNDCAPSVEFPSDIRGFDSDLYVTRRIHVTARDGVQIPVSLAYRKGTPLGTPQMMKLYGYGSYGYTYVPTFAKEDIPLLDRGVIFAVAHVRGGGEKGESWHDAGRLMNKTNTFNDFIDVTEHMVSHKLTSPDKLAIHGVSAGGFLVGAVVNMRPELYRVAVLGVPFVDVLNTMTLYYDPLAKYEKKEWGDGLVEAQYYNIKQNDPYTNLKKQSYPSLLVYTGFEDTSVYYFQPMKWVAKLRELNDPKTSHPVLFFTTFKGGHGGESGADGEDKTRALHQSYVLGELGITE